jgi:hypothetical protein
MQNADKTKLPLNFPSRISAKNLKCLAHRGKKIVEHNLGIAQYKGIQIMWYSKDHMKIIAGDHLIPKKS